MRITLRLANLAAPLARHAARRGVSVGQAALDLIADALGVERETRQGTAALSTKKRREQAREAAAARWGKRDE